MCAVWLKEILWRHPLSHAEEPVQMLQSSESDCSLLKTHLNCRWCIEESGVELESVVYNFVGEW